MGSRTLDMAAMWFSVVTHGKRNGLMSGVKLSDFASRDGNFGEKKCDCAG